jgi:hypothetical protein
MDMKAALAVLEKVFGAFGRVPRIRSEELDKAERHLGIALPQSLRLLYRRTGRHPFHRSQNYLVSRPDLGVTERA